MAKIMNLIDGYFKVEIVDRTTAYNVLKIYVKNKGGFKRVAGYWKHVASGNNQHVFEKIYY